MNIELNDMLVFEDEDGNIYRDCVTNITDILIYGNWLSAYPDMRRIFWNDINETKEENLKLKEIWRKTDEDTYKKVWSK